MNKLINLRYLYACDYTIDLISGIGKLTNLQELKEFHVRAGEGHKISELTDMNEIREHLSLYYLQNVSSKEEAAKSQLDKKKYLKSLEFRFTGVKQEVLDALKPSPSVETLTIRGGWDKYLPNWISSQNEVTNLKCVVVGNFSVTALPAFGELPSLEVLNFYYLPIENIGNEFYGCNDVVFPCLKELTFYQLSCWRAWFAPPVGRKSFQQLKKIHMDRCWALMEMPNNCVISSMAELKLFKCPKIGNIETVLQGMSRLTHLSIDRCCNDLSLYCTSLRFLEVLCLGVRDLCFVGGLKSLVNLRKLEIKGYNVILESFEGEQEHDEISQENQFLTSMHLSGGHSTQNLPITGRLGHLRSLLIRNSPVTEYTEEEENWFNQLTSLQTLEFSDCWKLRSLPSTLPLLTILKKLTIAHCRMISSLPEFGLPENLSSLEMLKFSNCPKLTHLPSTLPLLTKLKKLVITSCPSISSLPEAGLPRNLTELYINECSVELAHRCQSDQGDDWWKISHIPQVEIKVDEFGHITSLEIPDDIFSLQ